MADDVSMLDGPPTQRLVIDYKDSTDLQVDAVRDSLSVISSFILSHSSNLSKTITSQEDPLDCANLQSALTSTWTPLKAALVSVIADWNRAASRIESSETLAINPPPARVVQHETTSLTSRLDRQRSHEKKLDRAKSTTAPPTNPATRPDKAAKSYAGKLSGVTYTPALYAAAKDVATTFPDAPMGDVLNIARGIAPKSAPPKPKKRSVPHGAHKEVFVRARVPTDQLASVPSDRDLTAKWLEYLDSNEQDSILDVPGLVHATWTGSAIRFTFNTSLAADFYKDFPALCRRYVRTFPCFADIDLEAERFHFKSSIVYRNVSVFNHDGSVTDSLQLEKQIVNSLPWENVTITRCHFYIPPAYPATASDPNPIPPARGSLFIDFHDNSTSSTQRALCRSPILLGLSVNTCTKTIDKKRSTQTPHCSKCLRWGHTTLSCRSNVRRCGKCAGMHDEREHAAAVPTARVSKEFCFSCGKDHRSDSTACAFFEHRLDRDWIAANQPIFDKKTKTISYPSARKPTKATTQSAV